MMLSADGTALVHARRLDHDFCPAVPKTPRKKPHHSSVFIVKRNRSRNSDDAVLRTRGTPAKAGTHHSQLSSLPLRNGDAHPLHQTSATAWFHSERNQRTARVAGQPANLVCAGPGAR